MGRTGSTVPQCLYSTPVHLLPLWTVRPLQSLSACTVQLHLFSPYALYGLYRASVPVQYSYNTYPLLDRTSCTEPQILYISAIPLLPLQTVRPVQILCACTVQLYLYSPLRIVRPVQCLSTCTVQLYLYSPLRTVRPIHDLSAFTVQL